MPRTSDYDVSIPMTPHAETGKVIYALWGQDLGASLLDSRLHERLAALGVRRLQVNLDDKPVSAAMRIPSSEPSVAEPITASLSVWLDGNGSAPADSRLAEVTGVLGQVADRVAGWRVDERRPLDPDQSAGEGDGTRLDGLANLAFLRRPADLDEQVWLHRWLTDHTTIAIETQASFGYVQNLVVGTAVEGSPTTHAIVEELFPSAGISDIHAFYGSGGDDAELESRMTRLMGSVSRIGADQGLDLVPTSRYRFELADT